MDSLYLWLSENGIDPSYVAYVGAAIAFILILKMFFFQKKQNIASDTLSESTSRSTTESTADPASVAAEEKAAVAEIDMLDDSAEEKPAVEAKTAIAENEAREADVDQTTAAVVEKVEQAIVTDEKSTTDETVAEDNQSATEATVVTSADVVEELTSEKVIEASVETVADTVVTSEQAAPAEKVTAEEVVAAQDKTNAVEAPAKDKAAAVDVAVEVVVEAPSEAVTELAVAEVAVEEAVIEVDVETETETRPDPNIVAQAEVSSSKPVQEELFTEEEPEKVTTAPVIQQVAEEEPEIAKRSFFSRIKDGLAKTKSGLSRQMGDLFLGAKEIDEELLEDIETILLTSDIGIDATTEIVGRLTEKVERSELKDPDALHQALKDELSSILHLVEKPLQVDTTKAPYVILMVGVNGVGKTTTIGKLAKKYQQEGKSVMLAAGDTFRAAAVEQLQVWGERNNVPVVAQHTGADSASVLFDAVQSAKAKGVDVLIADTAGRLQNKDNLMQELQKVIRVMQKLDDTAPHEVMLVLDAGTGQNGLNQAQMFGEAVGVSGITLTKLDGTAKGGIIFAIAKQLSLPIRFIGVGEQVDDLQPFVANDFVAALFDDK